MRAVEEDGPWPLVFPLGGNSIPVGGEVCERVWSGGMTPQLCLVHRRLPARALWEKLLEAQYTSSEPAVLFIDRINSANNVSSGIEPIDAFKTKRCVRGADGQEVTFDVEDAAWHQYRALHGASAALPAHFVQSTDVCAEDQLHMMAVVQSCVDNAISKSLVLPESASAQDIGLVLLQAWELGLKGISVFRKGPGIASPF